MSIRKKFIGADQVDASKILLLNNSALRSKNSSDVSIELMSLDGNDVVQFLQATEIATVPSTSNAVTNKVYVDSEISLAKSAEESRAMAAESSLSDALLAEASRALAAEQSIASLISFVSENSDAAALDSIKELIDAINLADSSLVQSITDLSTAELSRAQAAEQSLSDAIVAETSRATAAEQSLSTSLNSEISRATAAEGSIDAALGAMMVEEEVFEVKVVSAQDVTNGYITVASTIVGKPVIMIDRVMLVPDQDFTVSANTITFAGDFMAGEAEGVEANDVLNIWYVRSVNGFAGGGGGGGPQSGVTLLMSFDGETLVDESSYANAVSLVGAATVSTEQAYSGTKSVKLLSGASADYVSAPTEAAVFGSGDFTIEGRFYPTSDPAAYGYAGLISKAKAPGTGDYGGFVLIVDGDPWEPFTGTGRPYFLSQVSTWVSEAESGGWAHSVGSSVAITQNAWNKVAVCREGGILSIWVNDVCTGVSTISGSMYDSNQPIMIGNYGNFPVTSEDPAYPSKYNNFPGYIDDVKIVVGQALYQVPAATTSAEITLIESDEVETWSTVSLAGQSGAVNNPSGIVRLTVDNVVGNPDAVILQINSALSLEDPAVWSDYGTLDVSDPSNNLLNLPFGYMGAVTQFRIKTTKAGEQPFFGPTFTITVEMV